MKFELIKIPKRDVLHQNELYAPIYESGVEASRKLKHGDRIVGSTSKKDLRNLGHFRKYWALLKLTYNNLPERFHGQIKSIEELRTEIKMQIGCREERVSISGKTYFVPKSMAFDKMGQEEFEEIYNKTLDFICEHLLPGIDRPEIEAQIVEFM